MSSSASDAWYVKKGGYYYRPKAQGYTPHIWEAGRFTYEEAYSHSHPNGPDGPRDGITMGKTSNVHIGLGGWLERVQVHEPGEAQTPPSTLEEWFYVSDANVIIAFFRNMDDAFTFKLDYINGKLNKCR